MKRQTAGTKTVQYSQQKLAIFALAAATVLTGARTTARAADWTWDGSNGYWNEYWSDGDPNNSTSYNHWGSSGSWFLLDWPVYWPTSNPPRLDNVLINSGVCYVNSSGGNGPSMSTLTVGSGAQVVMLADLAAWNTLTANGSITVVNGQLAAGTIVNNTTILIEPSPLSGYNSAGLSASVLSGTGDVLLHNNGGTAQLNSPGVGGTFTNSAGHTIHGDGQINMSWAGGNLNNHGFISADTPGQTLYLSSGNGAISTNDATISAVNGGILQFRGNWDNTGGTIRADGGTVQFYGSSITGGTLASTGTSVIAIGNSASLFNVALAAGANLEIAANDSAHISGTIANEGTITVSGSLELGTTTFTGHGAIVLKGANITGPWDPVVTLAPGQTLRGNGSLSSAWSGSARLDNRGTVEASGGTLYLASAPAQFSGNTLTGGTWIVRANSTLAINNGSTITTNRGTVLLDGSNSVFSAMDSLNNNQGSFTITNGRNFTTAGDLANSGTVHVGVGSTLTVNGAYRPTAGASTIIDGSLAVQAMTMSGTLGGSGSVSGNVELSSGAILAPGNSPGTLTINGDLHLDDGATYKWELSSTGHDLVHVTGDLDFGTSATLVVSLYGADQPLSGDYVLFDVDGTIGQLPQWTLQLPNGVTAGDFIVNGHHVLLTHVAVPEPASLSLLAIGAGAGLLRYRRRA